jgi:hypothetical protein
MQRRKEQNKEKIRMANIFPPNGNVGIGTVAPNQSLTVAAGNILLPDADQGNDGNLYFGGITDAGETGMRLFGGEVNRPRIIPTTPTFPTTPTTPIIPGDPTIPAGFIDVRTPEPRDGLRIRVDTVNGGTERMRITADGKVGIVPDVDFGKGFPREKLHVVSHTLEPREGILAAANLAREGEAVAISGVVGSNHVPPPPPLFVPAPGLVAVLGWVDDAMPQNTIGVRGVNTQGTGVRGESKDGIGVHGISPDGLAGKFDGNVEINGHLTVTIGGAVGHLPDYVFAPDYPLLPLDAVRTYLAEKKHLPNVPSAKTIQQEGLNMSEFQLKLLEKIEELTLYTLAQDTQLKVHQAQIERLQQRLASAE